MSITLYATSVGTFQRMLKSLAGLLDVAQKHAAAKNIDPDALLHARLYPDMFDLTRQVQLSCDFARAAPSRLSGMNVPSVPDTASSFQDLQDLIATTLDYLKTFKPEQIDGQEDRQITLRAGTPREMTLNGQSYLLHYALPQFYFHVTTTYALLRHNGVEIGKMNFMGVA